MLSLRPATSRFLQHVSTKTISARNGSPFFLRGFSTHAATNDERAHLFHDGNNGILELESPDRADYQKMVSLDEQQLTSLLMELPDRVGVLHDVLRFFWKYDVNIRRIESRPSQFGKFDFFVDVEGGMGEERDGRLDDLKTSLKEYGVEKLLTLDEKEGRADFLRFLFFSELP